MPNFSIRPTSLYAIFALFTGFCTYAQNDTIKKGGKLDEVVITGQYQAQSVRKSVYQVKVISRADIDRQAGNNLADLLNQSLNFNIVPNAASGKSFVSLFGLDAQYFKILIDNIPVINDEGLGNNTDLTQINLDDVQQIEIVEGSMGVEYGANAVSGIINIITKKNSQYKWEITPIIQEETAGDEYSLFSRGRHIQSLKVGHNFNSRLYANAMVTTNYFKGYLNDKQGKNHVYNDSLRGYEWNPKNQVNAKAFVAYNLENHRLFYKFEYFNETVNSYSPDVAENLDPATGTTNPIVFDDNIFTSNRYFNHLNATGKFSFMNYDVSVSYQQQTRDIETFQYLIRQDQKNNVEKHEYESRKGFYSKGNFSNFLDREKIDFQVGYEVSEIKGYASPLAGFFNLGSIERTLGSYDVFASTEIRFTPKISIRPGARALFSSLFDTQAAVSVSAKYASDSGYEFRTILGTAPRLPNYDELYSYYKDVNHDLRGNPELQPENGLSASFYINKNVVTASGFTFRNTLSFNYLTVKDRIEQIQYFNEENLPAFTFTNIDLYKTFYTALTSAMNYSNFTLSAGVTFSGTSKVLDSDTLSNDDYLFAVQANANASYIIPKWNTMLSIFGKYTGPQYQYVQRSVTASESILVKGKQDDFTMVDASISQPLFSKKFQLTVGARNLLDVTRIASTDDAGGAHNGPATSILMGYGRSYFLKLQYRFNY